MLGSLAIQFEDSISQYCGHFLKNFLGEAIVRDQKILIVDPATTHRSREWWLKFLPQVSVHQQQEKVVESVDEKKDEKLTVAWRYNDLYEEKMLAAASPKTEQLTFRFDNAKAMGDTASNSMSHALPR